MQPDRSNGSLRRSLSSSAVSGGGDRRLFPPFFRYLFFGVFLLAVFLILLAAQGNPPLVGANNGEEGVSIETVDPSFIVERVLPTEVNDRIDLWVHRYLVEDRATLEMFLERKGLYGEMILEKLQERGLPVELLFIPMIESAFTPEAVSLGSASGIWQFMDTTARAYGLVVNESIDERRDPVRATDAALDYLTDLHEMFGSWPLAVAAYNAGPETIRLALERAGGGWEEDLFWKIRGELPVQAQEYLPKLLAVSLITQNASHFGFGDVEPLPAYAFERVLVPGGTTLQEIATLLDLPVDTLRDLNPHLLAEVTPSGEGHLLRVPLGEASEVTLAFSSARELGRGN